MHVEAVAVKRLNCRNSLFAYTATQQLFFGFNLWVHCDVSVCRSALLDPPDAVHHIKARVSDPFELSGFSSLCACSDL
jgi:hypothetical protein